MFAKLGVPMAERDAYVKRITGKDPEKVTYADAQKLIKHLGGELDARKQKGGAK